MQEEFKEALFCCNIVEVKDLCRNQIVMCVRGKSARKGASDGGSKEALRVLCG